MRSLTLGLEIGAIAIMQPLLAYVFAEAIPSVPSFDMTGLTNLGATAVVSMLLVWVITRDRPAFLEHLRNDRKENYEALEHQQQQHMNEMSVVREEFKKDRDADREARKEVLVRVHEIVSALKEPK